MSWMRMLSVASVLALGVGFVCPGGDDGDEGDGIALVCPGDDDDEGDGLALACPGGDDDDEGDGVCPGDDDDEGDGIA